MKHSQLMNRRSFIQRSSAASIALKSAITGLPASFLLGGAMPSQAQLSADKSLILAMSDDGESVNAYAPGAYSSDSNDPRFAIDRPTAGELGTGVLGQVNGQNLTVNDFSESAMIDFGGQQLEAARYLSYLPQGLLDRMAMFHIRTDANGHPEGERVHGLNSTLMGANGRGSEEIQSAVMQEILLESPSRPTLLDKPMVMSGGGGRLATLKSEGVALTFYGPDDVKNLFLSNVDAASLDNLSRVYENTIDAIYQQVRTTGTAAQRRYLDAHASSRAQAKILGEQLGGLFENIDGDSYGDQLTAAVAMAKINLAPVIVVRYAYSRDNHGDTTLSQEIDLTIEQLNNLVSYWDLVQEQGVADSINYATFDIFGRTLQRNDRGGRDHHSRSCLNTLIGSNINPGVYGALESWPNRGHRHMQATGINSATGTSTNADISAEETLQAYSKTLMASVGIPSSRIDLRITSGKTIDAALSS